MAVVRGVLIGESLRLEASLRDIAIRVSAATRFHAPPEPPGGPPWWTFIEFEAEAADAEDLSNKLASCLDNSFGWYASVSPSARGRRSGGASSSSCAVGGSLYWPLSRRRRDVARRLRASSPGL